METPLFFKHETELQQEYVLETSSLRMTVIVTAQLISLKTTCSKRLTVPLFGAINDSDGYQIATPEEFWKHYHDYQENLYSHQPFEKLLLEQLYRSNSNQKLKF